MAFLIHSGTVINMSEPLKKLVHNLEKEDDDCYGVGGVFLPPIEFS